MRRGIFGGSFDPVHLGHLIVAGAAADRLRLDRVHFVPAWTQPFKGGGHHASPEDRLAMLQAALHSDRRFVLDTREVARQGVSYTVDTLRELRAEFPDDELCLLVGADAAREMSAWHEADAILQLARIVVLTRPGVGATEQVDTAETLEVPRVDISATAIRERVRRGEPIRQLVPSEVADYIEAHRLYVAGD
ncbi:MAG: nicotinate-nucleotide adenylyltransferase [Armatimonadota bacterium]